MIQPAELLADTKALVRFLVDDLRAGAASGSESAGVIEAEYSRAHAAGRTALARAEWAEGLYAQVAVAWVLGTVFVRFCEDNGLVPEPLLAGPGPRRAIALDQRAAYLREHPADDDRHWLREVFDRYRTLPATGDVFGDHNPIWLLAPSADGARQLLQKLQEIDPDTGDLRHDFTDPAWDTRFLGDLYQDLSEHAKKTYALLQTPIFVEEFILDRTLEPALATFGLKHTTAIDPTCGSGHFLLGIFDRLFKRWCDAEPGTNRRELARRALDALGGADLNPFAASIARFRLLVAALRAGGDARLADAPAYRIHVAVGDSLLHGDPPDRLPGTINDDLAAASAHGYATEDIEQARRLLSRTWDVVVGNPPYITVKDPALNTLYRARYSTCHRQYSLGVPFTERFFQLARHDSDPERAGYVGMITANSFMKREFGKKLIEKWVPAHDLTHVVDTSGAYIPGHGTPTVILFGRNRPPVTVTTRAVMGIRGEPGRPEIPEKGKVWASIVELIGQPGSASDYVSVIDMERSLLAHHPWSLGGGGAAELKLLLDRAGDELRHSVVAIGGGAAAGEDECFLSLGEVRPLNASRLRVHLIVGDEVRDWCIRATVAALMPEIALLPETEFHSMWPYKTTLANRRRFGIPLWEIDDAWWRWREVYKDRAEARLLIGFAKVATHPHFVLRRRQDLIFKDSAPTVLVAATDETRHLELLGALNSSIACFWMKQVSHNKGAGGGKRVEAGFAARGNEEWENHFEYDGTKLQSFPLPRVCDAGSTQVVEDLARELARMSPLATLDAGVPSNESLGAARQRYDAIRAEMIAAQERLDWDTYERYGLLDEELTTGDEPEPPLVLGERAFEIVLARRMAAGDEESSWFARHGSTPITELPAHWPESYKELVERRIEFIQTDLNIGLIERPEHKRRWAAKPWDEQAKIALRAWLLDRLEDPRYWPDPAAITTVARLATQVRTDAEFMQVARLYGGRDDADVAALMAELVKAEAVPYLAALRFSDAGMRKYAAWLETWELQRREDGGEDVGDIPVPPKYTRADFVGVAWDHRGKLDVPKEQFVSYPGAERETDSSLPVGWAGWDHLARARALATWYLQAKRDGREVAHLAPMLAGLAELVPWLRQWYDDPNLDPALDRPGTQIAALVDAELRALRLTPDDLAAWRPEPARRGRRRNARV